MAPLSGIETGRRGVAGHHDSREAGSPQTRGMDSLRTRRPAKTRGYENSILDSLEETPRRGWGRWASTFAECPSLGKVLGEKRHLRLSPHNLPYEGAVSISSLHLGNLRCAKSKNMSEAIQLSHGAAGFKFGSV